MIVVGRRRFTREHRPVGGEEEDRIMEEEIDGLHEKLNMKEVKKKIDILGMNRRLLAVKILIIINNNSRT